VAQWPKYATGSVSWENCLGPIVNLIYSDVYTEVYLTWRRQQMKLTWASAHLIFYLRERDALLAWVLCTISLQQRSIVVCLCAYSCVTKEL